MLRDAWTSGLVKLRCSVEQVCGRHLWVAPALQVFSGDVCGHFRQYRRLSGLFVWRHCCHWP